MIFEEAFPSLSLRIAQSEPVMMPALSSPEIMDLALRKVKGVNDRNDRDECLAPLYPLSKPRPPCLAYGSRMRNIEEKNLRSRWFCFLFDPPLVHIKTGASA